MELKAPDNEAIVDFKRKMKPLSEAQIQRQIMDYLNANPKVFAWRQNTGGVPLHDGSGGFRPAPFKGVSDIIGVMKPAGQVLAIEVKSQSGKLNAEQSHFLDSVRRAGGVAIVATSVDDVERVFNGSYTGKAVIPY